MPVLHSDPHGKSFSTYNASVCLNHTEMAFVRKKVFCEGNITSSGLRGKENIQGIRWLTLFFLIPVLKKLNCTGFQYVV